MVCSKLARPVVLGSCMFALLGRSGEAACPTGLDPYSAEPNSFGWPVTPAEFEHEQPECWAAKYERCGGERQSPMDLNLHLSGPGCAPQVVGTDGDLATRASYKILAGRPAMTVSKYMRGVSMMTGSSIGSLKLQDANGMPVEYVAVDAVLTAGGLHAVNGVTADAELLIVHEPKAGADAFVGRVVLSVPFRKSEIGSGSELFEQMGLSGGALPEAGTWRAPKSVDLQAATEAALAGRSLAYSGSMPMPPCIENVRYFVLTTEQPVSAGQLSSLQGVLSKYAGGTRKRPPVSRALVGGGCRALDENSMEVPAVDTSCAAPSNRSSACWAASCGASPLAVAPARADKSKAAQDAADMIGYRPTSNVTVSPSMFSLDAAGDFGALLVNGRLFQATKLSLKAVSQHTFNGTRYAAELVVEHILFGDSFPGGAAAVRGAATQGAAHGATTPAATVDAGHGTTTPAPHDAAVDVAASHGDSTDAAVADGSHHRRLEQEENVVAAPTVTTAAPTVTHAEAAAPTVTQAGHVVHRVMLSIPLKLGRESALLRSLGLGDKGHQGAIRDGNAYDVQGTVDLKQGLKESTSKGWYWYTGSPTTPGACPAWDVRWMVFEEPLELSLQQLNTLALQVSGIDSTLPPTVGVASVVSGSFVPKGAVEEGSCEHDGHYGATSCWTAESPVCGRGLAQSPIDIPSSAVAQVGSESFLAKASWKPVLGLRVENNGYRLGFTGNQMGYSTVIGPNGFPKFYQVTEVALRMPSEHMIDGKQFPAELQVIQKNQKSVLEYADDDVLVTSFMFNFGEESKLLKQLLPEPIPAVGESAAIDLPVDLMWALGPALYGPFFKYDGSYTTPGCQEAVQWAVFETPMNLSTAQWQAFKAAFPHGNNRPVQPLNGRNVLKNSMGEVPAVDHRFFLNRGTARDKRETPIGYIAFPIIGTLALCSVVMAAVFQREDIARKTTSAGGLDQKAQTIGKGYDKL